MIERILENWRASDWDFRTIAAPADPMADRFGQWVDYYRLKAAIAAAIEPASILEIGVRFGYSYAAFKQGNPAARYTGIDLDADTFGGVRGAIGWARALAQGTRDELLVADTQSMARFPGRIYDLIHVDGQQDGAGSYHDLELAVSQGRWVLVDGFLWTRDNCLSASDFLMRYKDAIEYALIIPGYAGELLLRINPTHLAREEHRLFGATGEGSEPIREHYTSEYYLKDCGGWESFDRHRAHRLDNARLQTLLDLALLNGPRRLLDLGCGRGEITYQAARHGLEVTAVDYSATAIAIAKTCFEGEPELEQRVEWICGSAADLTLTGEYDVVVAGDLVEHLSPAELDRMYATVARHLAPGGRLIVHTYPNLWFYKYHYARQRRAAVALGAYLSSDPRSRYEKLMHINEQSPRVLRRQLRQFFPHVRLWFLHPDEPAGNLARTMNRRELAGCRDLYAVASPNPIEYENLLSVLTMQPLPAEAAHEVAWFIRDCPERVAAGTEFSVGVLLKNGSDLTLHNRQPCPVNLCYHWRDAQSGRVEIFDGLRTGLAPALAPGESDRYEMSVQAPASAGTYFLDITLVQENVRWFEESRPDAVATRRIEIFVHSGHN